jgi:integrase
MRAGGRGVRYDGIVITNLGDRYQVRVRDPYRQKYVSAVKLSRREAEAWGKTTRENLIGRKITSEKPTLTAAAAIYLAGLRIAGKSASAQRIVALACAKAVVARFDDLMEPDYGTHLVEWLANMKADRETQPKVRALMNEWLADPREPKKSASLEGQAAIVRRVADVSISANTRNTYFRCIHTVIKKAATKGGYMDPLSGISNFKTDKVGKPVFTPPELRALLSDEHVKHPAWLATALLFYTGCRVDEGLHLRWDDIDFAGNNVSIKLDTGASVKGSKERSFPLQAELRDILTLAARERWGDLWQQRKNGFVISEDRFRRRKTNGALDKAYYDSLISLCKTADVAIVERRSPHSLRHSHAAMRVATGESPFRIQGDLGHEGIEMTRHYSREERSLRGHVVGWPSNGTLFIRCDPPQGIVSSHHSPGISR